MTKKFELTKKNTILILLIICFFMFFFTLPKIYLRNNIYYTSKDINKLYSQYLYLIEDNKDLSRQYEVMNYKMNIQSTIKLEDIDE